ncbi:kunitz-type trypsin inhibitor-like 2 protein [Trifolium pratense]|uniref:Kunitz-type trypsin inhibitor-like 2 protein n=1 Tax=Trifolium pratense TaxID=57577 RepID=A0A2K3LCE3_TRIPR|nr:kunitz-type trypsin inhibitor-like 2 protein [Trifolium pratense]
MKPVLSFTFSFFLFVLIANLSLALSNDAVEPVLDVTGNPIFPGGKYYIFPVSHDDDTYGGGLRLGKTGDSECEVTVLQDDNIVIDSIPVKFSIPGPEISPGIIFTGTPIEIEFTKKPSCVESSKWLIFVDDVIEKACIGIGGPENYPHFKTVNGTFHIEKHESGFGYKLAYCVKDSDVCLDIGRSRSGNVTEEGGVRLNLTHQVAYAVQFIDVTPFEDRIKSVA